MLRCCSWKCEMTQIRQVLLCRCLNGNEHLTPLGASQGPFCARSFGPTPTALGVGRAVRGVSGLAVISRKAGHLSPAPVPVVCRCVPLVL